MSGQASFEGFEQATAAPTDRLFFALVPDEAAGDRALTLAEEISAAQGLKLRVGARERFHITLFHVGDYAGLPAEVLARADQAAQQVSVAPFEVRLDTLLSFQGGPRRLPVVLMPGDPSPLAGLHAQLQSRLHRAGLVEPGPRRAFKPHLTLLYGHQPVESHSVDALCWQVREFVLIRSLIGQGRYIVLKRWQLTGLRAAEPHLPG